MRTFQRSVVNIIGYFGPCHQWRCCSLTSLFRMTVMLVQLITESWKTPISGDIQCRDVHTKTQENRSDVQCVH
jgi:hypothetical protein